MITHNGKYLLHATHHGMPIYAATMGGKLMLSWLLSATQQAILAAFGSAEGGEVIRKTNDYLNRIATTDPQRAQQISGFINEDPMLVCSLVETSKTRWLVGDGKAWINTGINASLTRGIEFDFVLRSLSNDHSSICLVDKSSGNEAFGLAFWDKKWVYNYGNYTFQDEAKQDIRYHYKQMGGNILLEGEDGFVRNLTKSASKIIDQAIYFPANNRNGSVIGPAILDAPFFKAYEGEDLILHQVPMLHPTEGAGMLDIVSLTFHPNANTQGSFTIALTDKQPTQ